MADQAPRQGAEEETNLVPRILAGVAAALVALAAALVLLTGADAYRVKARFITASQLVKGNLVQVSGVKAGTVEDIRLTPNGQAEVTMAIDPDYAPLRQGTQAVVRQASLSGVANRYIDLQMGPGTAPAIREGSVIPSSQTESSVDLDQLFDIFGPRERAAVRDDIKGFAETYAGRADMANRAYHYLNPALASSSRLFNEINRSTPELERFIVESSRLFSDVAERRTDVAGLVDHLATVNTALAAQQSDLRQAIHELPSFMRKTNTTFVNLRAALDDLDPLVAQSKPVVRKLRPLMAQLRPLAAEAVPAVRDLSTTISQPGDKNDLLELMQVQPPLEEIAIGPVRANGKNREGAFPASTGALQEATPELRFARPYAVDLSGWFDDFSASGGYDALGSFSRAGLALSALTFNPLLSTLPPIVVPGFDPIFIVDPDLRKQVFEANVETGRNNRCPGSSERDLDGSVPYRPSTHYNCDPNIKPIGP
jgi:phospholipid/cholesterol/gamma-HCH transport system substrate-binding protein